MLLTVGQRRRTTLLKYEEHLEQLCGAAFRLGLLNQERLCDEIAPTVRSPLTQLQRIIVGEVLLRLSGHRDPGLPLLLEPPVRRDSAAARSEAVPPPGPPVSAKS